MKILKWLFENKNEDVKEFESQENNDFKITKAEIEPEAICPYCKATLKKFPIRKTKCPNCKKSIFVRRLNESKLKDLLTEEQAQEIDIEREKEYSKYRGFLDLEKSGVTKDEFIKRKEEHYLKHGIENNNNDVVWSLFNDFYALTTLEGIGLWILSSYPSTSSSFDQVLGESRITPT